jgi:peptide/nickel transport system substrate-binding protein
MTGRGSAARWLVVVGLVLTACTGSDGETPDIVGSTPTTDEIAGETTGDVDDGSADDSVESIPVDEGTAPTEPVPTEPAAVVEPVRGGTLRYGIEADVDGLNPTSSVLSAPGQLMANAVFDTLAAVDTEGNIVPYLAESFAPVDGDLATWRVTLRPGVTFHDGTPFNAAAVQASFEAQFDSPLIGFGLRPFYPADNATEVIDQLTIQYNLLDANAQFPATLTTQGAYMASPTWLAAALADPTLNQQPVGTGPFKFESRTLDSITRVVRNDEWWGGDVWLDAIEFVPIDDPDTRADLLRNGDLNALHTTNPASIIDLDDDADVDNIIDTSGEESFVMLNTAQPPFDDVRARQALAYATPLQAYRDLIALDVAPDANQMFTPESPFFAPDVVQEGDQPDLAEGLAAAYCTDAPAQCSGGRINIELQWFGPSVISTRTAELLDQGWSDSFNVTFDELAQDTHIQEIALGQYQAALWRQFGAVEPSLDRLFLICRTIDVISLNFARYCTGERDEVIARAQATTDDAERIELWQEITRQIHDAYTYVFLDHTAWNNAFDRSVRGVCERTSPEGVALRCATTGATWFDSVWIAAD